MFDHLSSVSDTTAGVCYLFISTAIPAVAEAILTIDVSDGQTLAAMSDLKLACCSAINTDFIVPPRRNNAHMEFLYMPINNFPL